MGLFLPLLLLGLAQPMNLPLLENSHPLAMQNNAGSGWSSVSSHGFSSTDPSSQPVDRLDRIRRNPDPDARPTVCLTMRSYYFEQRDGLAPEFVKMTTCDPAGARVVRKIKHPARLVPAN